MLARTPSVCTRLGRATEPQILFPAPRRQPSVAFKETFHRALVEKHLLSADALALALSKQAKLRHERIECPRRLQLKRLPQPHRPFTLLPLHWGNLMDGRTYGAVASKLWSFRRYYHYNETLQSSPVTIPITRDHPP